MEQKPPEDNTINGQLKALAKAHPVLQEAKYSRRMPRLERMTRFYEDKAPEAPKAQSKMFFEFVSALLYAMSVIKMYQKLTRKLAKLAEEADEPN